MNGTSLPFIVAQSGADRVELLDLTLQLHADGSFDETATIRYTESGVVSTEQVSDDGTYTLTGTAISLRYTSDGTVFSGALNGDALTLGTQGLALEYRRR
ncbi:MAG TPA: hypothetical protein VFV33_25530 [Gemmatimonadaceae bacterium]|nr:hypothetical protein [Gemmatimonadaceae bacterium]